MVIFNRKSTIDDHMKSQRHLKRKEAAANQPAKRQKTIISTLMASTSTDHAKEKIAVSIF
jgi:hypothetical protein